ncbi:hypothetical protein [Altibacter lentus]|uniref:hypothetical protein n=1 Tax=Altibacter lentus TaxID=1223410 RepID=UPI000550E213|nr:hypothetical protein [Altibacter lentus]
MKKILDKWYLSVFIIPIILTYLTNYVELPIIFANWEYSIIASMTILIGILLYEVIIFKRKLERLREIPKKSDKKIVRELIETLNIDKFHEDIVRQDAWNGYHREDIHRIIEFQEKAKLIGYKTSSEKLNNLINNFLSKLDDFTDYSSIRVYGSGDWLIPFKDNPDVHTREKIKKETEKMNELTTKCFIELESLMEYLKKKEYI